MERINFREVGDLGKTLQKSAHFIRQNFVAIMKSSLLIVVVPFVIGAFLTGSSMSSIYAELGSNMQNPDFGMNPFGMFKFLIPGYLLMSISFMMFYIICIAYIKQYVNGDETIDQSSVFKEVKKNLIKVFFGGILTVIITYIGAIFCFFPGIYFAIVFSHIFVIAIIEGKGFGQSFSKSFSLIKGKFWDSFLLYLVSTFILSGISFIMVLPMYIVMGVSMFKNIASNDPEGMMNNMSSMMWFMPLYLLIYFINILIMATIQSANYYHIVESKEGIGIMNDIENIGN